jgi:hypothetical protein
MATTAIPEPRGRRAASRARASLRAFWQRTKAHQAELHREPRASDQNSSNQPYNPLRQLALLLGRLGTRVRWRKVSE